MKRLLARFNANHELVDIVYTFTIEELKRLQDNFEKCRKHAAWTFEPNVWNEMFPNAKYEAQNTTQQNATH